MGCLCLTHQPCINLYVGPGAAAAAAGPLAVAAGAAGVGAGPGPAQHGGAAGRAGAAAERRGGRLPAVPAPAVRLPAGCAVSARARALAVHLKCSVSAAVCGSVWAKKAASSAAARWSARRVWLCAGVSGPRRLHMCDRGCQGMRGIAKYLPGVAHAMECRPCVAVVDKAQHRIAAACSRV